MNKSITIRIERTMYGNGITGTAFIENRIDPQLLEDAVDPGGFILEVIGRMNRDLDRRQAAIKAADDKARREGLI
jgi:hypothetical protein